MASNAVIGKGTRFLRGDGATSENFTPIAEIRNIDFGAVARQLFEVTTLDSEDGWREHKSGFRDGGDVTLTMNFTRTTWADFYEDFNNDEPVNYRLEASDGVTVLDFAAYCSGVPISIPFDNAIVSNVTIRITGPLSLQT